MKLRSGKPYWIDQSPATSTFSPLSQDLDCQVVVLGGGVTGALAAYRLVQDGAAVVLIDRSEFGFGSTAASTGLLQCEVDTPLVDLIKQVGEKHAVHAYRRGLSAIDEIEGLVTGLSDSCGFSRRDSLYFASSCWHERRLKREYACRLEFGFDVEYLTGAALADVSSIQAPGAIRSRGDAQIDPFSFTRELISDASRLGLMAHSNTTVTGIEELKDCVIVNTNGGRIQAKAIVYATGYESDQHLKRPQGNLNSTYAVTSQPNLKVPGWPDECLIWETARPYFYARCTGDGRAMIGGADTAFSTDHQRDGLVERKIDNLVSRFNVLFPGTEFVPEYAWAGTFAETKDGLAYIGQTNDRPRAYFALGYGGNGITFSVIAAKLISDVYAGRSNDDAAVFSFER